MLIYVKPGGETVVSNESIGLGSRVTRVDVVAPTRPGAVSELLIMPASGKALPPYVCAPVPQLSAESVGVYSCRLDRSVTAGAGTVRYQIRFTYTDGTVEQTPAGSFVIQEGVLVVPPEDIGGDTYEEIKEMLAEINANYAEVLEKFDEFSSENRETLEALEQLFREITGKDLPKYYRPPQGIYSEENLRMAQQLGYKTVFWSLAYVDWYVDDQPTAEEAYGKLLPRIHNGAIVLLHQTSATNARILDDLLTKWENMGFRFASLEELPALDG